MPKKKGGGASISTDFARGSSEGTDVSLRDYIDMRIVALREKLEQRFELNDKALTAALLSADTAVNKALIAAKEAVDKAELAASKRFEATNEFRGQLADQAETFQRKDVAENELASLQREINSNRDSINALQQLLARSGGLGDGEDHQRNSRSRSDNLAIAIVGIALVIIVPLISFALSKL